jgi:hypothetical protein
MDINEHNRKVLKDAGYTDVEKQMSGAMHASKEFNIEDLNRTDDDTFPTRGQRLADTRVLPTRGTGLVDSRAYTSAGPNTVPAGDNWLREGLTPSQKPLSGYVYQEPNPDARHEANWPGERSESGMAEPGVYRPSQPGKVGGTPASSYVVKSVAEEIIEAKAGIFKSIVTGPEGAAR